jgi:hypothetical protein
VSPWCRNAYSVDFWCGTIAGALQRGLTKSEAGDLRFGHTVFYDGDYLFALDFTYYAA